MANNMESILSELLKSDALKGISQASGISSKNVESVLKNALPSLLSGASAQTKDDSKKEGFLAALENHGSKDLSNLTSFFSNVDITDGGKIVSHLLGNKKEDTNAKVAKQSGVDTKDVAKVLAVAAPLVMSVIGKKTKEKQEKEKDNNLASIASSLLGNTDVSDLLSNFFKK